MSGGIVFEVETDRVLQILAREIYDSPMALIRENLQNAYDAIRMRFVHNGELQDGGKIEVRISDAELTIVDNGVGMTEAVLRNNFWKAGSSGKHTNRARQAGVVGTFGIGAMANFGVCDELAVVTRAAGAQEALRSVAQRSALKISEECITLERTREQQLIGTSVTAHLDDRNRITPEQAKSYIKWYVSLLPVPVYLNGVLISQNSMESQLRLSIRQFSKLGTKDWSWTDKSCGAAFEVRVDPNGQVLVLATKVRISEQPVDGSLMLLQSGGQLMGLRSFFGLAPVPVAGSYQFGGFANLSFLQPTAGREALGRESVNQVSNIIRLAEYTASAVLSESPLADRNNAFLQWVLNNRRIEWAGNVLVRVLPDEQDVLLKSLKDFCGQRLLHYYAGVDRHIVSTFSNESSCLAQVVQGNPRRGVQLKYLTDKLSAPQVPDKTQITRKYEALDLSPAEASIILRIGSVLRDDYLIPEARPVLADISHGVSILSEKVDDELWIYVSRSSRALTHLKEMYGQDHGLFLQFIKDFVRTQIYPRIQEYVPSSTRGGVEALRKILERNRELYRYEEAEVGDFKEILGEYLTGKKDLTEVLRSTISRNRSQTQRVSRREVGSVEREVPGIVDSPVAPEPEEGVELRAAPPIIRDSVSSGMKILTTGEEYPQLNRFTMLLGLSDRLMRTESDFFRTPHTTRIIWGGHRIVYIFSDATDWLNLYYDIELKKPLDQSKAGGGMFPTTTLITKNRIFVPVPRAFSEEFTVVAGPREFFVRFDILSRQGD